MWFSNLENAAFVVIRLVFGLIFILFAKQPLIYRFTLTICDSKLHFIKFSIWYVYDIGYNQQKRRTAWTTKHGKLTIQKQHVFYATYHHILQRLSNMCLLYVMHFRSLDTNETIRTTHLYLLKTYIRIIS